MTSRVDSDGTTTTFGYDASDQLTSEVRAGGYSVAYTYDHNHNRLSKTTNGATEQYTYDAHDKLLTAGSKTYAYDLDGNCTSVTVGSNVTHLICAILARAVKNTRQKIPKKYCKSRTLFPSCSVYIRTSVYYTGRGTAAYAWPAALAALTPTLVTTPR